MQIADISDTFEDPLARRTRLLLKKKKCHGKVDVVYSTERKTLGLLPLDESQLEDADQYAALPHFRSRILPVLGTIPALFGNAMASYVLTQIAEYPTEPLAVKGSKRIFDRIWKDLLAREVIKQDRKLPDLKVTQSDCGFVFEETWRSRSALSFTVNDRLVLTRWDKTKEAVIGNLICLSRKEAERHDKLNDPSEFGAVYSQEFLDYVEERFKKEEDLMKVLQ